MTLKCIVCTGRLKSVFPEDFPDAPTVNQPEEGLSFTSLGQYGTTVFDPMDGSFLEINVCDECLLHREQEGGYILHGRPRRTRQETRYVEWVKERVDE